jgi:hypothetical protein
MDLTPKQQTSEAIRQAETIVIITGQHPSIDQAVSVVALAAILRKFGKKVTPIISDVAPAAIASLEIDEAERGLGGSRDFVLKLDVTKAEVDKLRYEVADGKLNIYLTPFKGGFAPSDVTFGYGDFHYDLVIVLGVPTRARIDRIYEQNSTSFDSIPMVNLDFHRSNENYGAVNLIEPNASSLCEMLVALSESLQSGTIDAEIATALLMGIVASTDRFTAAHTSPKSLTVAAQMMAAGARQQAVVKALYRDGKSTERGERSSNERSSERNNTRSNEPRNSDQRPSNEPRSDRERSNSDRQPQPAAQPAPRNNPVQTQPQAAPSVPQPQPVVQPVPAPQPQMVAPAPEAPVVQPQPVQEAQPQRAADVATAAPQDLPIIDPSHIELMAAPEEAAQPTPRPQAMPSADFAAAAEMFSRQAPTQEPTPDRNAS